ncbi:MAG TPA: CopG family antitoxin [Anaerolineae bacterium]|nr:CopG family antitoxin [Anaerolineae bacterium]
MSENRAHDPLPDDFESPQAAGEFWDTHSLADYWDETGEAHFDVDVRQRVYLIPVEKSIAESVAAYARAQGLSSETLINLWLSEKLRETA